MTRDDRRAASCSGLRPSQLTAPKTPTSARDITARARVRGKVVRFGGVCSACFATRNSAGSRTVLRAIATQRAPDKRERQGSGESRKRLRRGHSERGGRIARCRKSATSARQKSRNPDTGRGARTRSSGPKMLTSIRAGASKMSTSIRAEAPAADVAREQPGNPDGVQIRTRVQRAEGRILRFGGV